MRKLEVVLRVAIMQPTYLPWLGYFDMMSKADVFILLDNVQFEKSSWQQRNRIRTSDGFITLSVPVLKKRKFGQTLAEVQIADVHRHWIKHLRSLELNYRNSPYFNFLYPELQAQLPPQGRSLAEYNGTLISIIASHLSITTPMIFGSEINANGTKAELSANQVAAVGGTEFLAAHNSYDYVSKEPRFLELGITVEYHSYTPQPYQQMRPGFVPYMSAVDALFCLGPGAAVLVGRND